MVQEEIMKAGHYKVAEAYILFRAQRAVAREAGLEAPAGDTAFPVETAPTASWPDHVLAEVRRLLDAAFDGGFSDDDWADWKAPSDRLVDGITLSGVAGSTAYGYVTTTGGADTVAVNGKTLYRQQCASCHRDDFAGAPPQIPTLVGIGTRRTAAELSSARRASSAPSSPGAGAPTRPSPTRRARSPTSPARCPASTRSSGS